MREERVEWRDWRKWSGRRQGHNVYFRYYVDGQPHEYLLEHATTWTPEDRGGPRKLCFNPANPRDATIRPLDLPCGETEVWPEWLLVP